MTKRTIGIVLCLLLFSSLAFAELNLNPKHYKEGDVVTEESIGLSLEDWKKVVEEIKDLREINKSREEQVENSEIIQKQYLDLLENSQKKIDLYKENLNLYKEETTLYREELDKCHDKYLKVIKWNSYKTGFTFVLGVSTTIFAGWVFSEIAR